MTITVNKIWDAKKNCYIYSLKKEEKDKSGKSTKAAEIDVFDYDKDGLDNHDGAQVIGDTSIFAPEEVRQEISKLGGYRETPIKTTTEGGKDLTLPDVDYSANGDKVKIKNGKEYNLGSIMNLFKPKTETATTTTPIPTVVTTQPTLPTAPTIPYGLGGSFGSNVGTPGINVDQNGLSAFQNYWTGALLNMSNMFPSGGDIDDMGGFNIAASQMPNFVQSMAESLNGMFTPVPNPALGSGVGTASPHITTGAGAGTNSGAGAAGGNAANGNPSGTPEIKPLPSYDNQTVTKNGDSTIITHEESGKTLVETYDKEHELTKKVIKDQSGKEEEAYDYEYKDGKLSVEKYTKADGTGSVKEYDANGEEIKYTVKSKDHIDVYTDKKDGLYTTKQVDGKDTYHYDKDATDPWQKVVSASEKKAIEGEAQAYGICSEVFSALNIGEIGTDTDKIKASLAKLNKDNVLEVFKIWDQNYASKFGGKSLIDVLNNQGTDSMFVWSGKDYIDEIKAPLLQRAAEEGVSKKDCVDFDIFLTVENKSFLDRTFITNTRINEQVGAFLEKIQKAKATKKGN